MSFVVQSFSRCQIPFFASNGRPSATIRRVLVAERGPFNIIGATSRDDACLVRQFWSWEHNQTLQQQERLAQVQEWLAEADHEKYGKFRGRKSIRRKLAWAETKPGAPFPGTKTTGITNAHVNAELDKLLFARHALEHGGVERLEDMDAHLATSFLGENAQDVYISVDMAKIIIKEEFRYGQSRLLEKLKGKCQKGNEQQQEEGIIAKDEQQ